MDGRSRRNALNSPKTGTHRVKGDLSAPPASCRELEFLVFLGRTLCMRKTLLVLLLAAAAAVAATPDSNAQPATITPAIRHYLMPDHSIKSVFPDLLPQSETLASQPDNVAAGFKRTGFCRCSCGFVCTTSADCGGSSCDPFITCCARKSQNPEIDWFTRSFESSSHKTSLPDAILKEVLKAECK